MPRHKVAEGRQRRWMRIGQILLPLAALAVVLFLLSREADKLDPAAIMAALRAITWQQGVMAVLLTVCSYALLTTYDWLGARYAHAKLPYPVVMLTSFIAYSFNYTFGTVLGAIGTRARYYTLLKVKAEDIAKITAFAAVTSWIGWALVAGGVFVSLPLPIPDRLNMPFDTLRPFGFLMLGLAVSYVALCWRHVPALHVRKWRFKLPGLHMALAQLVPSALNWLVVGTLLYVLMPKNPALSPLTIYSVFLLGSVAGLVIRVPAGLGVLEATFLLMLGPRVTSNVVIASLLAFRAVYLLLPLVCGLLAAVVAERWFKRHPLTQTT